VRRIQDVKIIPENGNEPLACGLPQVPLAEIPITVPQESDPDRFALSLTGGATADRYSLYFWPAPARSATDAIVVTYDVDTSIISSSPATGPNLAQTIPYPAQFEDAILYYTMSYLLLSRADEGDREEAQKFKMIADQEVRENAPVDALTYRVDNNRAMP
jgi:hypothetical protein